MVHYLPSCKIKANHKDSSLKMQRYLENSGVTVEGCCRLSQANFNEDDTVITNCTSCAIITDEQSKDVKEISLYEYLLSDKNFKWPDYKGEKITIQDCYRTVHKPEVQKAVRECLLKMNFEIVEITENFDKCRFDGPFLYQNVSKNNLELAPDYYGRFQSDAVVLKTKEEIENIMKDWCNQYTTERVVCYCNSCLKGIQMGGANGIHLIDLLTTQL